MSRPAPIPWASLTLSSIAAAVYLLPDLGTRLGYDREAIAAGQLWRLVTGHWTHWSAEHLGWSLLVFALLGLLWERTGGRRRFLGCVLGSALLVSGAVWWLLPGMSSYRGLSGIDCALVTAVAAGSLRSSLEGGRRGLSWALGLALAGYFAKVFYEMTSGSAVFVDVESAAFSAVPIAHLAGGLYGLALGVFGTRNVFCRPSTPPSAGGSRRKSSPASAVSERCAEIVW